MSAYTAWRKFWQYGGPVLGLVSVGRLLDYSVDDVLLVAGSAWGFVLTQKAIWVLIGALAFFFSFVEWRHRNTPLTILSTSIVIRLEAADGSLATITRTQRLRANRDDVAGYQSEFWIDPAIEGAAIPEDSISMHVDHCLATEQDHMVISGSPKRWSIVHRFKAIPMEFFRLGLNRVVRVEKYTAVNAFASDQESYDVEVPSMYRNKKLELTVYFHRDSPCSAKNCTGYRIAKHSVIEENLREVNDGGQVGIQLGIKKPIHGETYRIAWRPQPKQLVLVVTDPGP